MKKAQLLSNITDSFHMITILVNVDKFIPRGLICNIVKHLDKLNNFVLSELHVLLKIIVIQLEDNNNTK